MIKIGSIVQRRTQALGIAVHTGIYVGGGKVIHFDGESSNQGNSDKIVKSNLKEFSDGYDVFVRREPIDKKHGYRVAEKARRIMMDNNNEYNGNYGLIFGKNCQDFTADCFNA